MLLPRTTLEQRSVFYEDVEHLLSPGFLSHPAEICGVPIGLRTLSSGDLFLLRARVVGGKDHDWKVWTVATSLWMLNGHCLLDESGSVPRLAGALRELPRAHIERLFGIVMGLFTRQRRAVEVTEAFCYESHARYKWKTYGGLLPAAHAGVPGVERLGSNAVQQMWMAFNTAEDQRLRDHAAWEGFKLVAMTNAPKGVRKIDQRDTRAWHREEQRREQVKDTTFYLQIGVLTPEMLHSADVGSPQVLGTKSVEQLENEMKMWVAGERDWHDAFIENYKRAILAQQDAERQAREERAEALRQEAAARGADLSASTKLVGYTAEQMEAIIRARGPGLPGARTFYEEPKKDVLARKYLRNPEKHGLLEVKDGKLIAPKVDADLTPPGAEDPDEEPPSLASLVQRRSVPYRTAPDRRDA